MTSRTGSEGFTFIELAFVAAALGVVLGMAAPSLDRWADRLRVECAAATLAQTWRLAHQIALSDQPVRWVWAAESHEGRLMPVQQDGSAAALENQWGAPQALPDTVALVLRRLEQPIDRVTFFADGSAEDATCRVVSRRTGIERVIEVDGATGRVASERPGVSLH